MLLLSPAPCILMLTAAVAIGNTAVSEANGKIGVMQGNMDSQDAGSVEGSITWPIQDCFGIQLDGIYSNVDQRTFGFARPYDVDFGGVGGHFFWRDNETAMLGLEAGYVFSESVDSYEIGIEAESYFKWITLGAKAGFASMNYSGPYMGAYEDKDGFFGQVYVGAYPMDDLLITAIVESRFDNTSIGIEVEYELPVTGLSIFASASKGASDYDQAFVGMRYYFGEDKPLIRRHRESDPRSALPAIVSGIGSYTKHLQEQQIKHASYPGSSTGGSGSVGGSGSLDLGGSAFGPGHSTGDLTMNGIGQLSPTQSGPVNVQTGIPTLTNIIVLGSSGILGSSWGAGSSSTGSFPTTHLLNGGTLTLQTINP